MGNARWKGARLRDVLARAGLRKEVVEIAFSGSDRGPLEATPSFVKSLPAWKALDENTLAYEMNGAALPHWNGFPVRLVVPGWTGTYWMKQVVSIRTLSQPLVNFWMNTAYRIPEGKVSDHRSILLAGVGNDDADHRDSRQLPHYRRERRAPRKVT